MVELNHKVSRNDVAYAAWCVFNGITPDEYWRDYWWKHVARTPLNERWFKIADVMFELFVKSDA